MRNKILTTGLLILALAWSGGKCAAQEAPPIVVASEIVSEVPADAETAEDLEALQHKPLRYWVRTEFLLWFIKPANFPPLVTTGNPADLAPGALGSPSTSLLFGQGGMDFQDRTGGRFTAGYWLDDAQTWGIEAGYFFLGGRALNQSFSSAGSPVLAMPFFNTQTGAPDSSLIAYPGILSGTVTVNAPSFLQGAEGNLTRSLVQTEHFRLDGLAGFRWLNLSEGLHLNATSLVQLAPQYQGFGIPFDGNTITVNDNFDTHNHFYGGQLGGVMAVRHKRWLLELEAKAALGVSHETVDILGSTSIDTQPATAANGGLFAVGSNSGQFSRNVFAVVPEAKLTLKFQLTDRIELFGGYSFLYWSNVVRPADQLDTAVNPNFVPTSATYGVAGGPVRPAFAFHGSSFYAHGAHFGVELRY